AEEAAQAETKAAEAALAHQAAQLSAIKAVEQAREDQKNSITNLVGFVQDLSRGLTNTGREVNRTVENMFRGIIAVAGGLDAALGPIEGDISQIASPDAIRVLNVLSDVMKNLTSNVEKTALASKLLGRQVGQEEVEFLSRGSAALEAYRQSVKD